MSEIRKPNYNRLVFALAAVAIVAALFCYKREDSECEYCIPSGYTGFLFVQYQSSDSQDAQMESTTILLDTARATCIRRKFNWGVSRDRFYALDDKGQRTRIKQLHIIGSDSNRHKDDSSIYAYMAIRQHFVSDRMYVPIGVVIVARRCDIEEWRNWYLMQNLDLFEITDALESNGGDCIPRVLDTLAQSINRRHREWVGLSY